MKKGSRKNNHAQKDLIIEFFKKNPSRDIKHPEVVDFTFYGSLSKGYAAESSDIDGMLDDAIKYFVE